MENEKEHICVASRGRNTAPDGGIEQHLEPCPVMGKTNCLTTVTKDNLILENTKATVQNEIIQVNPSKESHNTQPYQQNRVYHPDGKTPALMQGTGGRTLKVLTEAGGGTYSHTTVDPYRVRTLTNCAGLVQMGSVGNTAIQDAG